MVGRCWTCRMQLESGMIGSILEVHFQRHNFTSLFHRMRLFVSMVCPSETFSPAPGRRPCDRHPPVSDPATFHSHYAAPSPSHGPPWTVGGRIRPHALQSPTSLAHCRFPSQDAEGRPSRLWSPQRTFAAQFRIGIARCRPFVAPGLAVQRKRGWRPAGHQDGREFGIHFGSRTREAYTPRNSSGQPAEEDGQNRYSDDLTCESEEPNSNITLESAFHS
jgi:hypothetical protein